MAELVMDASAPNGAMVLDTRDGKRLSVTLEKKAVRLKAGEDNIIILMLPDEALCLAKALSHYAERAAK